MSSMNFERTLRRSSSCSTRPKSNRRGESKLATPFARRARKLALSKSSCGITTVVFQQTSSGCLHGTPPSQSERQVDGRKRCHAGGVMAPNAAHSAPSAKGVPPLVPPWLLALLGLLNLRHSHLVGLVNRLRHRVGILLLLGQGPSRWWTPLPSLS